MGLKSKKIAFLGMCTALALVLSYVESLIPPLVAFPGVKPGLPNLVTVLVLYKTGWPEAAAVSIIRVFLVSLLFGNIQTLSFSLAGAVLSLAGMILLRRTAKLSCISVSVAGGVLHNIGQVLCACFLTGAWQTVYLLPIYFLSGSVAGGLIGGLSAILVKGIEKYRI